MERASSSSLDAAAGAGSAGAGATRTDTARVLEEEGGEATPQTALACLGEPLFDLQSLSRRSNGSGAAADGSEIGSGGKPSTAESDGSGSAASLVPMDRTTWEDHGPTWAALTKDCKCSGRLQLEGVADV